jgi:hypothetical protein
VATQCAYPFSKSTKEFYSMQGAWHSPNPLPRKVENDQSKTDNDKIAFPPYFFEPLPPKTWKQYNMKNCKWKLRWWHINNTNIIFQNINEPDNPHQGGFPLYATWGQAEQAWRAMWLPPPLKGIFFLWWDFTLFEDNIY